MNLVFKIATEHNQNELFEVRYPFNKTSLPIVRQAVDDWIVYYRPAARRGDEVSRSGNYFAIARLSEVEQLGDDETCIAHVSGFLPFENPVPFRMNGRHFEFNMRQIDGLLNSSLAQRSVRELTRQEFFEICGQGFSSSEYKHEFSPDSISQGFAETEEQANYLVDRPRIVSKRAFRDAAFASIVGQAYDYSCAVSGLRFYTPANHFEVESAHIIPVSANGPDSVRNGIALTRTMHFLFDKGLITIDENFRILKSDWLTRSGVEARFGIQEFMSLPNDENTHPHPHFLRYHREKIFENWLKAPARS
jgi:putative restriction endonuclease